MSRRDGKFRSKIQRSQALSKTSSGWVYLIESQSRTVNQHFKHFSFESEIFFKSSSFKNGLLRKISLKCHERFFCPYWSPVIYFGPVSTGILDLLLHLLIVRNPKEDFCSPGIDLCQKYTLVWLVFEMSPLKIALKHPFFAPSSRFLEMLR